MDKINDIFIELSCPFTYSSTGLSVPKHVPEGLRRRHDDMMSLEIMPKLSICHYNSIHNFLHL